MKKVLLFAMLLLPQLLVAQMNEGDALPMLEAGRSWNYVRTHADGTTDKVSLEQLQTVLRTIEQPVFNCVLNEAEHRYYRGDKIKTWKFKY